MVAVVTLVMGISSISFQDPITVLNHLAGNHPEQEQQLEELRAAVNDARLERREAQTERGRIIRGQKEILDAINDVNQREFDRLVKACMADGSDYDDCARWARERLRSTDGSQ